jgi:tetratricopeptide (TPR) repeat protein
MSDTTRFGALAALGALLSMLVCPVAAAEVAASAPAAGIEPVFPVENESIVLVEGEDAVSTNFAREPVLNYSCSGFRSLQLNRSTGLQGVGTFYADFVFTVPSSGTWELWYGGTPPGPRDELYPSYSSPFQLTIDGQKPMQVSRETMAVVENYSPSFYWNLVGSVPLEARRHRVRFEVTEKRRIDGRYLFYLDCFFLVKKEGGKRVLAEPLPPVFPRNLDNRAINNPFPTIDDALIRVRDNPGAIEPLLDLSLVYTLLGDYLNAIKYLNSAALIQPKNADVILLAAKNRIWKGDTAEGLKKYRELLDGDPARRELWLEAGKVAAWTGRFDDSIKFFTDGLAAFPKDLDLTVNLGLTYVWASRGQDGERVFHDAQSIAGSDAGRLKEIARIYRVNGYPDRAIQSFNTAIAVSPQDLQAYLMLIEVYQAMGKTADSEAVQKKIAETFAPSPRLAAYLESFGEKQGLKEQVMAEYRQRLAENPDNLVLRQTLAQAYFWNGQKSRAIEEYRHILANHAYIFIRNAEAEAAAVLWPLDRGFLLSDFFARVPFLAQQKRTLVAGEVAKYRQALSSRDAAQKSLAAAKAAQAKAKEGQEADRALAAVQAEEDRLLAADGALGKEADALAALTADTRALASLAAGLAGAAGADSEKMGGLQAQDAKAEEALAAVMKATAWKLDRSGTLAELALDTADNSLARLVTAKIYMMDRQTGSAQSLLAKYASDPGGTGTGAAFTLAQSLLWSGKAKEAGALIASLAASPGSAVLPSYFSDLAGLQKTLEAAGSPGQPAGAQPGEDPLAAVDAASAQLAQAEKEAGIQKNLLQKNLALLQTLYRRAMVRAFFAWDQGTSSIRNELGDYDLAEEPPDLEAAIVQFRRVLAVDPNDLSATFRLGKVYQWKRDWKAALVQYEKVYKADPTFENVAALFNQVSREHADSLVSLTSYLADSQRIQWHAETSYTHLFNTAWSLSATYQTDAMRIRRDDGAGATDRSAYQVHDISLGVPIAFSNANATLTPWVGGTVVANSVYSKVPNPPDPPIPAVIQDAFGSVVVEPYAKLDAVLGLWNVVFLNTTLRWGRQPETLDPVREAKIGKIYDASAEANVTTKFSFIDAWLLRDTTLRAYGKVDLLHDQGFGFDNLLSTVVGELTVHLLKGGTPYSLLTLIGNVTWQRSQDPQSYAYYAPSEVLVAGGSLMGSTWIGVGGGRVLGLSLRGYGGTFQERTLALGDFVPRIKGEAEANVSLAKGNATWTLTALANATYNAAAANPWDYWSAFVRLGYSLKMPEQLAP